MLHLIDHRIALLSVVFLAFTGSIAVADNWVSALGNERANDAAQLQNVESEAEPTIDSIMETKHLIDSHNANQCTYPEGQEGRCAAYEQEGQSLNDRMSHLQAVLRPLYNRRQALTSRIQKIDQCLSQRFKCSDPSSDECMVEVCGQMFQNNRIH